MRMRLAFLAVLVSALLFGRAAAADPFEVWLNGLRQDAAAKGVSQQTLAAALAGLQPMADVLDKDRNRSEERRVGKEC